MSEIVSVNIAGWLACFTFLVGGAIGVLSLVDRVKGKPPTGEMAIKQADMDRRLVEATSAFEREKEYGKQRRQEIYDKITAANARAGELTDQLRREMSTDVGKLHEKVNGVCGDVREQNGILRQVNVAVSNLTAMVQTLSDRRRA